MRVLVIENFANTTAGLVGQALAEAGARCDVRRMFAGDRLPASHDGHDALLMLGGSQNALQDDEHPYLPLEAALARGFGNAGKPVLGICLGAQLLARGYGARNILGRPLEFGWHTVRLTREGRRDPLLAKLGEAAPIFHWHGDTFTLPPGAAHLASSEMTEMQAFRVGERAYGIQFHFEADTRMVEAWNRHFADEIEASTPDWFARHAAEAARHGVAADAAGLALARGWVGLINASGSSRRARPATRSSMSCPGAEP